ncbi:hypothetical protein PDE_06514 [Penicillium oxalicum 114-2]|uniref:Uncharacterized protein n=1 Tax=Penicillium oxalicum (strain 114-2 / CGMCC 5302) TaxID=933388 RepID=S7ZMH2_PENO1|nr:hypothetical protein PDE_06514 [Penicillium oxalicum 114-2]
MPTSSSMLAKVRDVTTVMPESPRALTD